MQLLIAEIGNFGGLLFENQESKELFAVVLGLGDDLSVWSDIETDIGVDEYFCGVLDCYGLKVHVKDNRTERRRMSVPCRFDRVTKSVTDGVQAKIDIKNTVRNGLPIFPPKITIARDGDTYSCAQ
jgi:hypothetical protein